jgi:hypothetical protein
MEQLQVLPTPLENMPGLTPALVQKLNAGESRRSSNWRSVAGRSPEHSGNRRKNDRGGSATCFRVLLRSPRHTRRRWSGCTAAIVQKGRAAQKVVPETAAAEESSEKVPEE